MGKRQPLPEITVTSRLAEGVTEEEREWRLKRLARVMQEMHQEFMMEEKAEALRLYQERGWDFEGNAKLSEDGKSVRIDRGGYTLVLPSDPEALLRACRPAVDLLLKGFEGEQAPRPAPRPMPVYPTPPPAPPRVPIVKIKPQPEPRPVVPGVYLLHKPARGLYKVGCSNDVASRTAKQVGRGNYPSELVHTIRAEAHYNAERWFHAHFDRDRLEYEWFILTEAQVAWFCSFKNWPEDCETLPPPEASEGGE